MPNTFTLEGEIDGLSDSTVLILSYLKPNNDNWTSVEDSTYVIDNKFALMGELSELTAASLMFNNFAVDLYLEPTAMKLKLDKDQPWNYKLSGTKIEKENLVLREMLKSNEAELHKELCKAFDIVDKLNSVDVEMSKKDSLMNILTSNIVKRTTTISRQINSKKFDYVLENKTSKISCELIYHLAKLEFVGIDTLKNIYNDMPEELKASTLGRIAYRQLEQTENLQKGGNIIEGCIAPDFSTKDISGKEVKLSEIYAENYVLLDFWASWCQPCMKQMPLIRELNNIYDNKGLKIIGLSSDKDTTHWKNTVEKHKLGDWLQVLSSSNSNNYYFPIDISDYYGVKEIPAYFLIDKKGEVVARWNHIGEEETLIIKNLILE